MLSRLMTRKEQLVLLAFAGAVLVGAGALTYNRLAEADAEPLQQQAGRPSQKESPPPPRRPQNVEPAAAVPEAAASNAGASNAGASNAGASNAGAPALSVQPEPLLASLASQPEPPAEPVPVVVSATGEVAKPDVYTMPEDARVRDLLERAGGPTDRADISDINLAARLIDGTTLTVPPRRAPGIRTRLGAQVNPPHYTISGWQPAPAPSVGDPAAPNTPGEAPAPAPEMEPAGGLIDLNSASQEALETLPGIGPKLAGEIIAYRTRAPFASVDDLTNVSGIGVKKLEAVRPLVTVR